ncbi:MAG: hypothetical protein WBX00_32035 [Isosphaeraceae bacterium]|jgi:hypothetical protein
MRVIIVDCDEHRTYEEDLRQKSMERTRNDLQKLQERVAAGKLKTAREDRCSSRASPAT